MKVQTNKWPFVPGSLIVPVQGSDRECMIAEGAKNPQVTNLGCYTMLTLCTYNCRTLSNEAKLQEIEEELDKIKWDIVGLSEIRRKGEGQIELKSGHIFYYRGNTSGRMGGVGFIIHKRLKNSIVEIESMSDRVAKLVIKLTKKYEVQIIQVYAPTTSHSDEEVEDFYEDVQNLHDKGKSYYKIVMGDFNAKVGAQQKDDNSVGKFGHGSRNDRGDRMVEFSETNNMFIMNSFFKKPPNRKWTWRGPNGVRNEIDYILVNKKNIVQDISVLNQFNTGSDHKLVRCRTILNAALERSKLVKRKFQSIDLENLKKHTHEFQLELKNRFSTLLDMQEEVQDLDDINFTIKENILDAAKHIAGNRDNKPDKKLTQKTKILMKKRCEMKNKEDSKSKLEYVELCKTLRRCITDDVRAFNCDLIKKTIEENKSLKKTKQRLMIGKNQIIAIKEKDGTIIRNRELIVQRVEEFYKKLYEDRSHDANINEENLKVDTNDLTDSMIDIPDVLTEEVKHAVKHMKNGKAPGEDNISIDIIKAGGEELEKTLARCFTECLKQRNIPIDWSNAVVILLYKKGDKEDLKNYRPISLLPVIYKIFTKVLTNRLQKELDAAQSNEQAGFRSGFSTMDHLQVVREVIQRCNEYELPLYIGFIDYEKAFDSIYTQFVLDALKRQGIHKAYIDLIKNIYKQATSTVRLHKDTNKIQIQKGVRQGDTISPKLFTATLEEVFRNLNWEFTGLRINGVYLSHLRFADDIVLFASSPEDLQKQISDLNEASSKAGLKMNLTKTKVMFNKFIQPKEIEVNGTIIEEVNNYVYLGQLISTSENQMCEINRRMKMGWSAFGKLNSILKGKFPLCLKRKVFDQCVLPVMTYGSETWTLNAKMIQKLQTTQRSMERCMIGITRRDRKRITWIRTQTKVCDIIEKVKQLKWNWAGHVARRKDNRWTTEILNWIPRNKKRPRRRPNVRWEDEIKKFAGSGWKQIAEDRNSWKHLGEAFIQQWIDIG